MESSKSALTRVVCLILRDAKGKVLCTQRPAHKSLGLLWEFPGGKVEVGEDPEIALRREIQEELGVGLGALWRQPGVVHSYAFGTIELIPFLSRCYERPQLVLHEHAAFCWLDLNDWKSLEWAPADIPIIENLLNEKLNPDKTL